MARKSNKKSGPSTAIDTTDMVVGSCYIEEQESYEEALQDQQRQFAHWLSLGNGGYRARAFPLSDDR